MIWSICVLTQPGREEFLDRLMTVLGPQVAEYFDDVQIVIRQCNPSMSLGENRNLLLEEADGEFISAVDDDDLVSFHFVKTILPCLKETFVDYVGFKVQMWEDGVLHGQSIHSTLKTNSWCQKDGIWLRDISHVNPLRKSIASRVKFEGGRGEDHRWADGIRNLGLPLKEIFIDDIMYLYDYRPNKPKDTIRENTRRPVSV